MPISASTCCGARSSSPIWRWRSSRRSVRRWRSRLAMRRPALPGSATAWDFLFYLSSGLAVTSSVAAAGVLLVFCFLIIPAVIGSLFSLRVGIQLAIGWGVGIVASAAGLLGSFALDLPTGAALVVGFAIALLVAGLVKLKGAYVGRA